MMLTGIGRVGRKRFSVFKNGFGAQVIQVVDVLKSFKEKIMFPT